MPLNNNDLDNIKVNNLSIVVDRDGDAYLVDDWSGNYLKPRDIAIKAFVPNEGNATWGYPVKAIEEKKTIGNQTFKYYSGDAETLINVIYKVVADNLELKMKKRMDKLEEDFNEAMTTIITNAANAAALNVNTVASAAGSLLPVAFNTFASVLSSGFEKGRDDRKRMKETEDEEKGYNNTSMCHFK